MRAKSTTWAAGSAPPTWLLRDGSLFLDFDGTLVELAERPDAVRVSVRLRTVLAELNRRLAGRVAIISGRAADEVSELLAAPGLTIVGCHGMEFRFSDGRAVMAERPPQLDSATTEMSGLAEQWQGVLLEEKPLGSVLHYRLQPDAADACIALATEVARRHGLHLQSGKMMVEVRAAAGDKGAAVRRLMEEPIMRSTHPIFLGDDDTDEPAFAAAQSLGGAGVLVGEARATVARYRLAGAGEVVDWLEQAIRQ